MKSEMREKRMCPKCRRLYTEAPALSREDNETLICADCGILESLESIGISEEERLKILGIIHRSMAK